MGKEMLSNSKSRPVFYPVTIKLSKEKASVADGNGFA
jgi:hypothetical protein